MKGTSQTPQPAATEGNTTANDSEDERWEDKLVIDLDASGSTIGPSSSDNKIIDNSIPTTMEVEDSNTADVKDANDQSTKTVSAKNGRSENNTPLGKPKGKRGQKKANDINATANVQNTKPGGKAAKPDKEKTIGAKPGRKKKEKLSPLPIKTEAESSSDDPYKFDPKDEKIASTAIGKSNAKAKIKGEPKTTKDAQTEYDWRSVAIVTEPENLGPCEPGTQVCLEGIVWQETNNGVLVVNVTWKGKTYMGTLLDATKHDWSPPSCDSPTGDFEGRTPKGRGKRSRVPLSDTFKDINERKLRKEMRKQSSQNQGRPKSPACSPKSESGKRKGRSSECDNSEPVFKRGRATSNNSANSNPHSPPTLIECPEPNCGKKYKQMNGLKYHQRNAHPEGSSSQVASDTASEGADKTESVSSPEEPNKNKANNSDGNTVPEVTDDDSKDVTPDTSVPEGPTKQFSIRNNTTSVITPTSTSFTNVSTQQLSNVPIATITPQVVKHSSLPNDNEQARSNSIPLTSTANRTIAISGPPKLISKPTVTNSTMAPISTITSPTAYNSTLKPIQPKPTILGEMTPNPGLHDLKDQKKLKRRRSASKEELINPPAYPSIDVQRPQSHISNTSMHRFDTEHRGLLSTGGMINAVETQNLLQSPSYSDISEEGEIKNSAARRELLSASRGESSMYSQPPYLVATVSPQKNAPLPDSDSKSVINRRTPSHSPVHRNQQEKHKQMQQYLASHHAPWAAMSADQLFHAQMLHMQNGAKDKSLGRSLSPKPNSFRHSGLSSAKDIDSRASNDQLQLLKENMEMKTSLLSRHGLNDAPHDYSLSPNTQPQQSNDYMSYADKHRELEQQDHHKREMMKTISPANKIPSSSSSSKQADPRYEKLSRSSPMPPPGTFAPFMAPNAFLPFAMSGLAARGMQHSLFSGFPGFPNMPNMPIDNKDSISSGSPSYGGKSGHKIHELADGLQSSKSPRPSSSGDRQMSSKTQPITSQSAAMHPVAAATAAAMLGQYGAHPGLHPSMAGLYPPPK